VEREDLTEPQRRLLDRANSEPDGVTVLWTRGESNAARNLAAFGLGVHGINFIINDAGRRLAR